MTREDEAVHVTVMTDPEHVFQRYGDDLYRLALLLALDAPQASRALLALAHRLATASSAPDEPALIAALREAMPEERRRWWPRRRPAWAVPPTPRAATAPLLLAIARLPRQQRLALGLTLLRGFDMAQAAPLLGGDEAAARAQCRDALLALAPQAAPELARAALLGADAPDACRAARALLALGSDAPHTDPAARGHLALCADCRAVEQGWLQLTTAVEQALRGALRDTRLPDELAERLSAAGAPQAAAASGWWADPRLRIALVALPVLALIGFLIFPRGARNLSLPGQLPAAAPADPRELIQRAGEYLYTPSPGSGVWHARYAVQWSFAGGAYALLAADQWLEPASGRHRLQLVHQNGGGPYEFELGDGAASAWYAVSPSYAPSLYQLALDEPASPAQITATPDEQQRMLQARLRSGAWDLPAAYLRQAQAAHEIQTWGRQRDADSAILSLISFQGASPLAPPPDAPEAATGPITVLLAIDETSGRLREVRELHGPPGGEQITRTTWRVEREEWQADPPATLFNVARAWNGVGTFRAQGRMADPALPLVAPERLTPLALAVQRPWTGAWMPRRPPPGATSAMLVNRSAVPIWSNSYDEQERLTFVYLGAGRRLELSTRPSAATAPVPMDDGEGLSLNGQQIQLLPTRAQGYWASVEHASAFEGQQLTTWVSARGYTRAEMLDIMQSLGLPSLDVYRAQARLFAGQQRDDAAFEALLGVLDGPPAQEGSVRHTVERTFQRHDPAPDPLADPYHRPSYGGMPDRVIQETWTRGAGISGTLELASSTHDLGGALLMRMYAEKGRVWIYNAPLSQLDLYIDDLFADIDIWASQRHQALLNMIGCGQAQLSSNPDGTRTLSLTESNWQDQACLYPYYAQFFQAQIAGDLEAGADSGPYLADLLELEITTWVDLDASDRLLRVEVRTGTARDGLLLESWELERDELLPPDRIPAAALDATPPNALVRWNNAAGSIDSPEQTVTLTEALGLARSPLFGLASPKPVGASDLPTTTTAVTATPAFAATLAYVSVSNSPSEAPRQWFVSAEAPFQGAVSYGYAVQLAYSVLQPAGWPILSLYEGPASSFGAYLRAMARWSNSAPISLQVGERTIDGWQVTSIDGTRIWTLFELDGTLIAVEYPPDKAPIVIAELQRLAAR